ncbi:MAG TPA: amino acid adenylation domain-containing protein, partial [Thermoanaerobaculia bacterium]|nr:amino acid adenylation domain-containing protein [Thermoanaerobaculia bacterium]
LALIALVLALTSSPAAAADIRQGMDKDIVIGTTETIDDDLYAFGVNISINGTIRGDLIAVGQNISVDGNVTGDVVAAGNSITIRGQVGGSVRAAGQSLFVDGKITDDLVFGGNEFELTTNGRVGRDALVGAQTVTISGQIGRDLQAGSSNVRIDGGVGGDVLATVDRLQLTDRATVGGDLKYTSRTEAQIANTSSVKGTIQRETPADEGGTAPLVTGPAALVLDWLKGLIGLLILGILVVFFFPGFSRRAGEALVRSPWVSLAVGALVLIGLPILAIAFFAVGVLIGGWWIGLVVLALYGVVLALSIPVAGVGVGGAILRMTSRPVPVWLALLIGLVVLLLVALIPILGPLVFFIACLHRPRALFSVDLGGLLPELRSAEADRLTQNEARRPFDLLQGPLFHSTLLVLGETGHRLLVTLHHMICDGWSLEILAREVGALYRQEPLPALSFQYADYADWQRRWPGEILDEQLGWWTETLAGLSPLELSTDRPRPAVQSFRGGLAAASLTDQAGTLNALAREHRATPFMLMLVAWQILLHRLTGQTDVAVGSPTANRSRPETEDLVGFFANNLVLRADLSGDLTFAEALARVRETALAAYAHLDLPFERLVAELAPERDLSRSALFQVAFSFQQAMALDLGTGLHEEILDIHTGTSKFDLWLQVEPSKEGWRLRAEYAADLLDRATVHRRLGNLRVLLEGIAASPEARISDLPLLTPEEIEELTSWNRTAFEAPQEPVHRLFQHWAERTPDALAVAWDGGQITYGELAGRADRLASWLRLEGAGPEAVVALRMERSPDLVTAALAILEAGGAYLPIDPANPPERVKWILKDSGALMELTEGMAFPEAAPTAAPAMPDPDLLAYVIYTSGSTGTPKGAELRHRSLSSFIAWHRRARGLGPSDRTTMIAGPGFDASVMEIWGALTSGASLHIPPPQTMFSPAALLTWLAEQRITVSFMPTPLAEAVLAEPLPEGLALRALLTGGDRLRSRPAPGLSFEVINHYGPTETTIAATVGPVEPLGEQAPDIGSPVGNSRAYVLDRNLRQVPLGAPGELCVAGDSLARGYRGRPDLTAERFVPDPFGAAERLYRTGDLARWLPDGKLCFLGRIDHQVKLRGLRIELGEIESVLRQHPWVRQAVAAVTYGRALTAYYVPDPEREPSSDELRKWLSRKLPAIMVPAVYVQLDELPLTVNGKIDRRALPAPPIDPPPSLETPRTLMQTLVAGVFGEVLGVSPVPLNVRFFDLGGNSLMATQVVTILQDVLPIELDLRKVIEGPTVARLAAVLEEERAALPEREREATAEILAELESSLFVSPNAA